MSNRRPRVACFALGLAALAAGCGDDTTTTGSGGATSSGDGGASSTSDATTTSSGGASGSGGGSVTTDHEVFGSGSRLRARVLDAGGGALDFVAFHDVDLDTDCRFAHAADGTPRCVPVASPAQGGFSDAACTKQAVYVSTCLPPAYVTTSQLEGPQTCVGAQAGAIFTGGDTVAHVYALGAPVPTLYRMQGGSCVPDAAAPSGTAGFELGAEVDAGTFAGGTEQVTDVGAVAQAVVVHGDDGSFIYTEARNKALDYACHLSSGYCEPPFIADVQSTFSDDACTSIAGIERSQQGATTCPPATAVKEAVYTTSCAPPTITYYGVASEIDGATVHYQASGSSTCQLYGAVAGNLANFAFFTPGAVLSPDTIFPTPYVPTGTGRVTIERRGLESGQALTTAGQLRDTEHPEATCDVWADTAGTLRCLPRSAFNQPDTTFSLFADAACTTPLAYESKGCAPNDAVRPYVAVASNESTCAIDRSEPTFVELREAVAYTGPVYMLGSTGTCSAFAPPTYLYFTLGDVVDPAQFQTVSLVTE
ncbi:MAG TPA: hypothetical protein VL400_20260 [Polyangiaceae bacterium]|nr:hypothetical protein [Polyangiaceae bacterium]